IIWNETQISNTCLCAGPECTAEYCLGSRALGKPLLEEYVSGNYYITNPIAKKINIYFELIAFVVFILSTLYFILLYKKARA
ncbi:MAG: hypothetical protein MUF85_03550, partial [Patescibacteria group bacterium]|nr:hypothetical protein [Patescibacteria group bacterium]